MGEAAQNITEWYRAQHEAFEKGLNGDAGGVAQELRRKGIERFTAVGFPTTRDEEWRFTSTASLARVNFTAADRSGTQLVTREDVAPYTLADNTIRRAVLINGQFAPHLSSLDGLPAGVTVSSLSEALRKRNSVAVEHIGRLAAIEENAFAALQSAFLLDGLFIHVADGTVVETPVHILFLATKEASPQAIHPRLLVVMGDRAQLSLAETYGGLQNARYFTNVVSEMTVGEESTLHHDLVQVENPEAFHVGTRYITQGRASAVVSNALTLGGGWVRNTVQSKFSGEGGECTLNGLSLASGEQLVDNHTVIDHAVPRCASHELYKSILDGKARGVFNGKIFVRHDAQKTDARQTNKTLLLSDDATIDTKPQLEIFADDVKCTHGATVGQLDEDQVFYLRARGIDLQAARDILTFAFAGDVVNRIHIPALRATLDSLLHARLRQGRIAPALS
jgi:Fe-S cluster assembly protein SufD